MNALARSFLFVVVSLAGLVGVLFALRAFFDPILGEGATAVLVLVLAGVTIAAVLIFLGQGLNNSTHRSAGEDITDFARAWSAVQKQHAMVDREYARMDRERLGYEGKRDLLNEKAMLRLAERMARPMIEAERQKWEGERQAEEAGGYSVFGEEGGPSWAEDVDAERSSYSWHE